MCYIKEWFDVLQHLDSEDSGMSSDLWKPASKTHSTEPGYWRSLCMPSDWSVVICCCAVFSQASQLHPYQSEINCKKWCSQQPKSWAISVLQMNLLTFLPLLSAYMVTLVGEAVGFPALQARLERRSKWAAWNPRDLRQGASWHPNSSAACDAATRAGLLLLLSFKRLWEAQMTTKNILSWKAVNLHNAKRNVSLHELKEGVSITCNAVACMA